MQIELTGSTSAGKSTLLPRLVEASLAQGYAVCLSDEFVLGQIQMKWVAPPLARTLLIDAVAFWMCLVTWRRHSKLYTFALRWLLRLRVNALQKLNLIRNVLKKIGIYELIQRYNPAEALVLVDEGSVHIAHNLFVHLSTPAVADVQALATFARLTPLPDVVLYLKQPVSLLIDRTLKRGHKRIPLLSQANVEHFIAQATAVSDWLAQHPAIADRILIVDGQTNTLSTPSSAVHPPVTQMRSILQAALPTLPKTSARA